MNVEIEEISPCRRKLNIVVPVETITSEYDDAIKVYSQQVQIPGFRPGKAPKNMVKARYNKDILARIRDHILPKSYHEALMDNKLSVLGIIDMDEDIQVKEGEALSYSVTVDIRPEITLPEYKGISLKKDVEEVKDADVDERIEALREQRADYEDVEDRPVARGDMAQIDFTSTIDGTPLEEVEPEAKGLGEANDFWLQASDEAFIPELGLALAGLSIGDEQEITATFPADFVVKGLQGKEVVFAVKVKAVRARKLPELDEEFFTSVGAESEEDFRSKVRESMESEKDRAADGKLRQDIEELLLKGTEFDLPESLVAEASNQQVRQIAENLQRNGQGEDALMEQKDEILATAKTTAERQVKLRLILTKIAGEEKITVSDNELSREITMLAYAYQMDRNELEKRLKDNNQLDDLRGDVICRKVVQWVQDEANIEGEAKKDDA
jgi:trigger factor